ncbi:hypothetical protein EV426DRAFT_570132 [Tirmania nivea]|nr:hypothetical protein EV426DRAFT_570132 [Tirmania nivea]
MRISKKNTLLQGRTIYQPQKVVGIVGAGMSGLYAAFDLQRRGVKVHLYELDKRVGGRVLTRRFTSERHQYYEAGAMRIPDTKFHQNVKYLVNYLNKEHQAGLNIIPYRLEVPGNRIFVNGMAIDVGVTIEQTAASLGFTNVPEPYASKTAPELLYGMIESYVELLDRNFELGWEILMNWDHTSLRRYLLDVAQWPPSVIEFVETICSQTNQYTLSFPEMVMQSMDFNTKNWWTLDDGMDRLPQALARVVGLENITFGARVQSIIEEESGQLRIRAHRGNRVFESIYDKVLLAIPPGAVRMIPERPRWSLDKEQALRSMHFEALYKIGIRFKTRFWERLPTPCMGGQSTTDLPIRWIVYPSYGLNDDGPGVLLLYAWMTDASLWPSVDFEQRVNMALTHLATVYADTEVDIFDQFISADDTSWAERYPMGDSMFLPGQFTEFWDIARNPEGNIYFAGEHLSRHHTWIAGALDSANTAVQQILKGWKEELHSRGKTPFTSPEKHALRPVAGVDDGFVPAIGRPLEATPVNPEIQRKELLKEGLRKIKQNPERFKQSIITLQRQT